MSAAPDLSPLNLTVRAAGLQHEREGHFAVRQSVFVRDQRLFAMTDRDERDDDPSTIHLIGEADDRIVGAVRLYPLVGRDRWQGDRLAVIKGHRASHIGADLVRLAVRTAANEGGSVMEAHVQVANVRFFEHLGWRVEGPTEIYIGTPHQMMIFDLTSLLD